jgi:MOSC domain-containing protein
VRLVRADDPGAAVDRARGSVSMLSEASLEELRRRASCEEPVDPARFRMLIGIGGVHAHEEDEWLGRRVRVGEAVVVLHEQVARCAITTQNPKTGVPDFDTLRQIKAYRGARDRKLIDFGVYGEVDEPGRVRLGDPVEPH